MPETLNPKPGTLNPKPWPDMPATCEHLETPKDTEAAHDPQAPHGRSWGLGSRALGVLGFRVLRFRV